MFIVTGKRGRNNGHAGVVRRNYWPMKMDQGDPINASCWFWAPMTEARPALAAGSSLVHNIAAHEWTTDTGDQAYSVASLDSLNDVQPLNVIQRSDVPHVVWHTNTAAAARDSHARYYGLQDETNQTSSDWTWHWWGVADVDNQIQCAFDNRGLDATTSWGIGLRDNGTNYSVFARTGGSYYDGGYNNPIDTPVCNTVTWDASGQYFQFWMHRGEPSYYMLDGSTQNRGSALQAASTYGLGLANNIPGRSYGWEGSMWDARIWHRKLSPDEILRLQMEPFAGAENPKGRAMIGFVPAATGVTPTVTGGGVSGGGF
jgi:hypothetical protein